MENVRKCVRSSNVGEQNIKKISEKKSSEVKKKNTYE